MAVLFPKKVPAFSRALGESDDSFDFETEKIVPLTVSEVSHIQVNEILSTFIIAVGSIHCKALGEIIDFYKSQIVKEVCLSLSNRPLMTCSAHKFDDNTLIWLCNTQQRESCYGYEKWIEALISPFKLNNSSCVYILSDAPSSEFQSESKPTAPFVRVLKTPKANSECQDIKVLEPPNIISGFAAALMSHYVYESLPACVLITYYDNVRASSTDQDIASVITPILRSNNLLLPYIIPLSKSIKSAAQNFDQMYI